MTGPSERKSNREIVEACYNQRTGQWDEAKLRRAFARHRREARAEGRIEGAKAMWNKLRPVMAIGAWSDRMRVFDALEPNTIALAAIKEKLNA